MNIIYKSIKECIDRAIEEARKNNIPIERIELTHEEWRMASAEMAEMAARPLKDLEDLPDYYCYTYCGVAIKVLK